MNVDVGDVEDVRAGDVRRHQVRRELNTAEIGVDDARQRFDGQRFRRAGHAFDQRVAFGQQRDQDLFDRFVLADDYFAAVRCECVRQWRRQSQASVVSYSTRLNVFCCLSCFSLTHAQAKISFDFTQTPHQVRPIPAMYTAGH